MAKQQRWVMKEKCESATKDIEKAQEKIIVLSEFYKEHHPKYAEAFEMAAMILETAKEGIQGVHDAI